jgi:poly(3-hydroxybutyrate) depolymerase
VLVVPEATSSSCAACATGLLGLGANTCRPWAANAACCLAAPAGAAAANWTAADDSTYIMSVLAQVKAKYAVDEARIYVAGHEAGCAAACHASACRLRARLTRRAAAAASWPTAWRATTPRPLRVRAAAVVAHSSSPKHAAFALRVRALQPS